MPAPLRQPAAASALEQTETALAAAQDAYERAGVASMDAHADAAALRASVKAGDSKVTPADLAEADALADHAPRWPFQAPRLPSPRSTRQSRPQRPMPPRTKSCRRCRGSGHDITLALSGLEEALVPVLAACRHYDGYVETAISHLHAVARPPEDPPQPHVAPPTRGGTAESPFTGTDDAVPVVTPVQPAGGPPRVVFSRFSHPRVDRFDLTSCRDPGQVATVLLPAILALGANESLIEGLRLLAAGAPHLPGA